MHARLSRELTARDVPQHASNDQTIAPLPCARQCSLRQFPPISVNLRDKQYTNHAVCLCVVRYACGVHTITSAAAPATSRRRSRYTERHDVSRGLGAHPIAAVRLQDGVRRVTLVAARVTQLPPVARVVEHLSVTTVCDVTRKQQTCRYYQAWSTSYKSVFNRERAKVME